MCVHRYIISGNTGTCKLCGARKRFATIAQVNRLVARKHREDKLLRESQDNQMAVAIKHRVSLPGIDGSLDSGCYKYERIPGAV